ncbi:MAG: energy-coupling factor ABC transporter permease [Candidatus Humimicrobiaceae bacterium]
MKARRISLIFILFIFGSLFLFPQNLFAMHISEGILPFNWAGLWFLVALPFLIMGIFGIKKKSKITPGFKPLLGLMGALVFIISCMPIPVPTAGTCSHPCGTAMSGILLGPIMSVFVASIALLFQALFLAHGGLTTWGADIVSMGIAGSFAGYFIFKLLRKFNVSLFISGFAAGILADWATYTTTSFELASALHGSKSMFSLFMTILVSFIPTQLPLGILEGFLTGGMIVFVYKRRPDILASLGVISKPGVIRESDIIKESDTIRESVVIRESAKPIMKNRIKIKNGVTIILILIIILLVFLPLKGHFSFAENKWVGVDESVVEKVAEEHGRTAWTPFINTDRGDLLLFVFLLAGTAGGFVSGFFWRKLFIKKEDLKDVK